MILKGIIRKFLYPLFFLQKFHFQIDKLKDKKRPNKCHPRPHLRKMTEPNQAANTSTTTATAAAGQGQQVQLRGLNPWRKPFFPTPKDSNQAKSTHKATGQVQFRQPYPAVFFNHPHPTQPMVQQQAHQTPQAQLQITPQPTQHDQSQQNLSQVFTPSTTLYHFSDQSQNTFNQAIPQFQQPQAQQQQTPIHFQNPQIVYHTDPVQQAPNQMVTYPQFQPLTHPQSCSTSNTQLPVYIPRPVSQPISQNILSCIRIEKPCCLYFVESNSDPQIPTAPFQPQPIDYRSMHATSSTGTPNTIFQYSR